MKDAVIIPIAPGHLQELIQLCREHALYEGSEYVEDGQAERLALAFFGTPPALYGWVIVHDDRLVGFMTATREFATWPASFFIYMDCLYLREPYRGLGFGRRLLDVLTTFSQQHGCSLIEWQTPPDNKVGIGFYERIGAVARDKKRFFYPRGNWENGRAVL